MENLDPDTQEEVEKIIVKMSSFGYARVVATLNSVLERSQITLNQTHIEQNWVLIKQQDENNKLLRQLVDKK
ncbi:hypothetical protein [Secundilactobacillus mixtipabuli]|uniref:Uncharacterized protein n=1 Tax=Secundilactobacillus mixtipabuli TaxID=1435342 RepID=A0A1Z5ID78_9LACO|nr:hypothetical protein [Secundilactobacillus mixtipabuli]GAW99692.1 hypothetical protein IWT30_01662 [Secundilactobacillus mixtipabuli]